MYKSYSARHFTLVILFIHLMLMDLLLSYYLKIPSSLFLLPFSSSQRIPSLIICPVPLYPTYERKKCYTCCCWLISLNTVSLCFAHFPHSHVLTDFLFLSIFSFIKKISYNMFCLWFPLLQLLLNPLHNPSHLFCLS